MSNNEIRANMQKYVKLAKLAGDASASGDTLKYRYYITRAIDIGNTLPLHIKKRLIKIMSE